MCKEGERGEQKMKKVEILRGVKDAEEKVERLKKDAIMEKEKIIKNSKRRALMILEEAKDDQLQIQQN